MPEPEPYYEPSLPSPRPSTYSADSYASAAGSTDLLRKATAGRRLPPAPGSTNGNRPPPNAPRSPAPGGLPTDPRPSSRPHPSARESSSSTGSVSYTSSVSRNQSVRPPGALPPTTPGHNYYGAQDDPRTLPTPAFEISTINEQNNGLSDYHQKLADSHHYHLPSPSHSGSLGVPNDFPRRTSSRDNLQATSDYMTSTSASGYTSSSLASSPCMSLLFSI